MWPLDNIPWPVCRRPTIVSSLIPDFASSSLALTAYLEFISVDHSSTPLFFVNSQIVCLPPVGIFKAIKFI